MSKSKRKRKKQQQRKTAAQKPGLTAPLGAEAEPAPKAPPAPPPKTPWYQQGWGRLVLCYLFTAYLEVFFRLLIMDTPLGSGLLYGLLFAIPAALVLFVLCGLFSPVANRRIAMVLCGLMNVLYGAQLVYNGLFGTYFILFSVLNGGEAFTFYKDILVTVAGHLPELLLLILPFLALVCYGRKKLVFATLKLGRAARYLATAALCYGLCVVSLFAYGTEELSPYDLYFRTSDVRFSVERLGLVATLQVDAARTVTGFEPVDALHPEASAGPPPTVAYVEPQTTVPPATEAATEAATEPTGPEVTEPPFEPQPQVMDIDFEALMADTQRETLLEMHTYFAAQEPSYTHEKTGSMAGSNVIFIVAEGFSHYAIDAERTPTLHKMATEGFEFTNFYNPVWSVSTSDGEYVATQGLIPKSGVWSFKTSHTNYLPFQLGRMMPSLGYSAHGYHNHSHTYYGRNLSHPNLGYDFKAVGAGLNMEPLWPESDHEMIDETTADYINEPPFHAYYMTVSGHLNYNFNGNSMAWRHYEMFKDLPASEAVRAYLACNYELELAMTLLLERLEEAGQLENTLIVISADHYPYGLEPAEIDEIAGHPVDEDFERYKSALIMYKPGTPHEVIEEPCSSLDILPTVLSLLGAPYDSRLLMGRDIFSDSEPLVIFSNRSFLTADARYNTRTKELLPNAGAVLPEGYRQYWSNVINQKFTYSARILDEDYYRVLWPEEAAAAEASDPWRK